MALPSQMDRTTETARQGSRRQTANGNGKLIGGAIVAVAAIGLVWGAIQFMGKPGRKTDDKSVQPGTGPSGDKKEVAGASREQPVTGPLSEALKSPQGSSPEVKPQPSASPTSTLPEAPKPAPVDVTKNPNGTPVTPTSGPGTTGTGSGSPPTPGPSATPTPGPTPAPGNGAPPTAPPNTSLPPSESSSALRSLVESGDRALVNGKQIEARALFSRALLHPDAVKSDQAGIREKLKKINDDLVFSKKITPGDPMVEQYTVASGDALEKISRKRELLTRWELIMRVNGLANPGALQIGQKLKLVRGPFHAVVHKSQFRLDLFWGSPDDQENWVYVRSFTVGLGADNGTPLGTFVIKNRMKNPSWKNPKTGEQFGADDPKNPIGEYWLGWQGQGAASVHTGFGLHGTIDPSSIGQQKSMGCVRMADADIAMVWEFLSEKISVIRVEN
ncbi:MAG: L,D-transpeptidase family protein [Phycisphaerales bacterium]